uniref:Uncharacterized protein n=1 Tax=Siphoviridae sp. ctBLh2 TaxID=2827803 RepID=A0A8S5S3H2_9CAUD|nr:MAG TPA: hypothetical protein [Siphoviridae sp. ctBLh2]
MGYNCEMKMGDKCFAISSCLYYHNLIIITNTQ